MALAVACAVVTAQNAPSPIHFSYRPIGFRLDSSETPRRYAPETMAGGVAVFDYNNDGYLDIFFTNGADICRCRKPPRSTPTDFSRMTERETSRMSPARPAWRVGGSTTGLRLAIMTTMATRISSSAACMGITCTTTMAASFTDVTVKAGLTSPDTQFGPLWSVGGAWVDVNNDWLLDLLVVNYLAWDPKTEPTCEAVPGQLDYCHPKFYKPTANQLFLNKGGGTFHDISEESGIRAHPGKAMGIGVADFDQDGLMDFFITNDKMNNSLFHNKGGGHFEEIAFQAGVALTEDGKFVSGMGVDAQDMDNDGLPDIVLVALDGEMFPLFHNMGKRGFVGCDSKQRPGPPHSAHGRVLPDHRRLRQ